MEKDAVYKFGPFRLHAGRHILTMEGKKEKVPLRRMAVEVLLTLVESAGKLVAKDNLIDKVWASTTVEPNNLDQLISSLRRALGETPGENKYIETVAREGYRFVAPVQIVEPTEQVQGNIIIDGGNKSDIAEDDFSDFFEDHKEFIIKHEKSGKIKSDEDIDEYDRDLEDLRLSDDDIFGPIDPDYYNEDRDDN